MNHSYSFEGLAAAGRKADDAHRELRVQEAAEDLRQARGLAYKSIGDNTGPYLAAFDGELIGEVWTDTPGVLHGWRATSYASDARGGGGPFLTARAAAASLLKP
jgi:hypothetical protein